MKSIIFEASSISKAVEQGWKKAGKPQQFSIKILEEEEKNFLGMLKKPAKIALFFEETAESKKNKFEKTQGQTKTRQDRMSQRKPLESASFQKQNIPASPTKPKEGEDDAQTKTKKVKRSNWDAQMIDEAKKWTTDMLGLMKKSHISFSTTTSNNNIKFHFQSPLLQNKREQKILFSNFAFLLMQTLRYKFRKSFRHLKAVFVSNE